MPNLLIGFLILGALGLFLAMPGGRTNITRIGFVVLAAAAGTLIALLPGIVAGDTPLGGFTAGALVALFAALRVITHQKPVYSALYFVLLIIAVTVLLVLMQAEFLAAALVIVYAGAILVTYAFVIMLAQQGRSSPYDAKSREPFWGCLAGFALLTVIAGQVLGVPANPAVEVDVAAAAGTVEAVGTPLLTQYVVGMELIGVLLLAAMVGAIAIARRRPTAEDALEGEDPC